MKARLTLGSLGMISMSVAAGAQALPADATAEKAVAAAQEQWTQSERTNNPDLVAPLLGQAHLYRY